MRILIDQDAVLYGLHEVWTGEGSQYHKDYHHFIPTDDIKDWDVAQFTVPECGKKIYNYFSLPELWSTGLPIDGSIEYTQKLVKDGHELCVVTSFPTPESLEPKMRWLQKYFPHIKNTIFVNGRQKQWIDGDVIIDDALHNLENHKAVPIVFDQPWNRTEVGYLRAYSWENVYDIINALKRSEMF